MEKHMDIIKHYTHDDFATQEMEIRNRALC